MSHVVDLLLELLKLAADKVVLSLLVLCGLTLSVVELLSQASKLIVVETHALLKKVVVPRVHGLNELLNLDIV